MHPKLSFQVFSLQEFLKPVKIPIKLGTNEVTELDSETTETTIPHNIKNPP